MATHQNIRFANKPLRFVEDRGCNYPKAGIPMNGSLHLPSAAVPVLVWRTGIACNGLLTTTVSNSSEFGSIVLLLDVEPHRLAATVLRQIRSEHETSNTLDALGHGFAYGWVGKQHRLLELRRHPEREQRGVNSERFHPNRRGQHHGQRSGHRYLLDRTVGNWKSANGRNLYGRRNLHDYRQRNERRPQWRHLYWLLHRAGYLDAGYNQQH